VVRLEALRTVVHHPHRRIELDLWHPDTAGVKQAQTQAPNQNNGTRCREVVLGTRCDVLQQRNATHQQSVYRVARPAPAGY
jgi:hypothetical protein